MEVITQVRFATTYGQSSCAFSVGCVIIPLESRRAFAIDHRPFLVRTGFILVSAGREEWARLTEASGGRCLALPITLCRRSASERGRTFAVAGLRFPGRRLPQGPHRPLFCIRTINRRSG